MGALPCGSACSNDVETTSAARAVVGTPELVKHDNGSRRYRRYSCCYNSFLLLTSPGAFGWCVRRWHEDHAIATFGADDTPTLQELMTHAKKVSLAHGVYRLP